MCSHVSKYTLIFSSEDIVCSFEGRFLTCIFQFILYKMPVPVFSEFLCRDLCWV